MPLTRKKKEKERKKRKPQKPNQRLAFESQQNEI